MKIKLHWKILIGLVLGVAAGLVLLHFKRTAGPAGSPRVDQVVGLCETVGAIFVSLLKMVIIPLIVSTMISGILSLGSFRRLGQLGFKTMAYYFCTTALSVATGLILVNLVRPGDGADLGSAGIISQFSEGTKTWPDLILSMVPSNPVASMAKMEVLPVIVFSLLFGAALLAIEEKGKALADVIQSLAQAMYRLTEWVIRLAPYGVFALMAVVVVNFGWPALRSLMHYILTVSAGLAIHFFITLPLIAWLLGRYSPWRLMRDVSAALLTAFSSASSSATLPLTMDNLEQNTGIPNRYTSFILPIGATVNMDGTALYEAVAVLFIAQAYGIELGPAQQIIVFFTATLAAVGAAAIPSAGLFTMAIVLKAVGLPLEGVALIIGVDRVLDMMRTATNVWGDVVGTVVVAKLEGEGPGAKV